MGNKKKINTTPKPIPTKQHSEETKQKISSSMIGNLNAETYTLEEAIKLFGEALLLSTSEEYDFIGEIAKEQGVYHSLYNYLIEKFPELKPIYNNIKNNIEANCFRNAKKGDIVPSLAIINLKSNHGWTDRNTTSTDITTGGKPLNLSDLISFSDDSVDE